MTTTRLSTTFGDRLRRTRKEADLEAEEMGDLLLLSRNAVSAWENDRSNPSPRKIQRWAEIVAERTGYKVDEVLTFLEVEPPAKVTDVTDRRRNERRTQRKSTIACYSSANRRKVPCRRLTSSPVLPIVLMSNE